LSTEQSQIPKPAAEALERWRVVPIEYLGGRSNQHWLVESQGSRLVLRGYSDEAFEDIEYELEVLSRLRLMAWPVPVLVEQPVQAEGRAWCLFTWLPGLPMANSPEERRTRGRLLADLHESTGSFAEMGQRRGFCLSDDMVRDTALVSAVRDYERICPAEGHILRWHLDRAQESFDSIDLPRAETIVLHSDFTQWNLLFEAEKLTGVLDFEATHLNYRVADFALSWRGYQDEVIDGYQEVHKLTDLDWELLIPAYWSWLFHGVKADIKAITSGKVPPHRFEWQIKHLMRRSGLLAQHAPQYPR
jgi:aminoglycoside phosphotransferase (APT) family kinase protein